MLQPITDAALDSHLPPAPSALTHLPEGAAQTGAAVRSEIADNGQLWAIHPINENGIDPNPVGVVGIGNLTEGGNSGVTSTLLFDPEAHGGKGYGTAAKLGAMATGYEAGVQRFLAEIAEDNVASQRSAAKVGFVQAPQSPAEMNHIPTGPEGKNSAWGQWIAFDPQTKLPPDLAKATQAFDATRQRYSVEALPQSKGSTETNS